MKKLTESKFGKFEKNKITGLIYLKGGGECTGCGGINRRTEIKNGVTFEMNMTVIVMDLFFYLSSKKDLYVFLYNSQSQL